MRSSVVIPVEKCPRTKSCLDVAMTMVMRRKETLGADTVLPEHVCQAESGCVMSCNLTMQAEFIQRTLRWCLTHRQQNDARALNFWLDVYNRKTDEISGSSSAHHSTETRRRAADLIPVLMVAEQLAQSVLWIRGFCHSRG